MILTLLKLFTSAIFTHLTCWRVLTTFALKNNQKDENSDEYNSFDKHFDEILDAKNADESMEENLDEPIEDDDDEKQAEVVESEVYLSDLPEE